MTKKMTRDEVIKCLNNKEICIICKHFNKESFEMPCVDCRMWRCQDNFRLEEVEE